VTSTWSAMLAGKSGVRRLNEGWAADLPVQIAAPADVDLAAQIPVRQSRRMDRCQQLGLVAARRAWRDAGAPEVPSERLGVCFATGIGGMGSTINAFSCSATRGGRPFRRSPCR
jgi:3-oxoacyl-[acyl-carrier-protein] synthase II